MTTSPDQWLTLSQAAQHMGVSEQTMRTYADKGLVPCIKIGPRAWRMFRPEDVDQARRRTRPDA